jgi:hypothetical protein
MIFTEINSVIAVPAKDSETRWKTELPKSLVELPSDAHEV